MTQKHGDEETINNYIKEVEEAGSGMIVLKDKVILKNGAISGTINYNYSEILGQMQITEFTKQSVIDYANSTQVISLYVSIFITIFIYSFMMYLVTTLSNAVFLSVFGYLAAWVARIRMRFVAIFNMSIYALTLSTILNILYIAVNIFINFNMEYFQIMYVSVIFILKSEFLKRQAELMKIAEAQEIVKKELEQKEQEDKEQKEKKERQKKDKEEEKKKKEGNVGEEPEGSEA